MTAVLHTGEQFTHLTFFFFSVFLSCSILNKLAPEKFDKLCLELLNVGVDSKLILKGVILLVSDHLILL